MERIRVALLAAVFIGIAVLIWLWSSSLLRTESFESVDVTAPQQAPPAPQSPPDTTAAPTPQANQTEPAPPDVVPPSPFPNIAEEALATPSPAPIRRPDPPKAVVSGTVTIEGQPATGFSLNAEVVEADGSKRGVPVQTSESGAYRLESPPGDLQILFDVVDQNGARPTHIEMLTVAAGRTYQLDYDFQASGSIRGHVTGIAEGEYAGLLVLLGEYTIEATVPDDIYALADEADGEMTVRRDGEYVLDNLEAGRYTVVVITRLLDEQQIRERDYEFRYTTGYVDVQPGQEAEFNVTLE